VRVFQFKIPIPMPFNKAFINLGLAGNVAESVTLLLIILGVSLAFLFLVSRYRLHNFLINIYISLALISAVPQNVMSFMENSYSLLFLIFVVLLAMMNRYMFDIYQSGQSYAMWKAFVMSFLEVTLMISIIFSNLSSSDIPSFISQKSLVYLIDPWWKLLWMVLPLLFLIFIKKRER